ncbi:MAG TPA: MalY/PatB family protein [Thermotogota bacterium]|nr:MalY/PatB family protein [Thermotogota bacterium]
MSLYDFESIIERKGSDSIKWDYLEDHFGTDDALPMWVADMDFSAPPEVVEALVQRARHGVFGYTGQSAAFYASIVKWLEKRHGWTTSPEWMQGVPGVVPAVCLSVLAFTQPGDRVVIQTPVYYPFFSAVEENGRKLIQNPLQIVNGRYRMDLGNLEKQLDERTRMLVLCSPHNPVGRVWERQELEELGEFCVEHDLLVVSDEIHSDLVFQPHRHVPYASIKSAFAQNSLTCIAPSKTFNLAGLSASAVIIPNPALRSTFFHTARRMGFFGLNTFGTVGLQAAYEKGGPWLEELLVYLEDNFRFLEESLAPYSEKVSVFPLEGTYLAWLDFRGMGLPSEEVDRWMVEQVKVAPDHGTWFGEPGKGFQRLNIACPRAMLEQVVGRLTKELDKLDNI